VIEIIKQSTGDGIEANAITVMIVAAEAAEA